MAGAFSQYPWVPTQNAQGMHVVNEPGVFTGQVQFQKGRWSFPPSVTSPGTVASAGTVTNSTGYDCLVYAQPVSGSITAAKVLVNNGANQSTLYSLSGTVGVGNLGVFYVPGPAAIAMTYNGSAAWTWVPL